MDWLPDFCAGFALAFNTFPLLDCSYLCRLMTKKVIVMSGIRPTGFLHLGNYFGALRNYVRMQDDYNCFFMVADLHSLTTHPDTKELKAMYTVFLQKILPVVWIPIK